MTVKKDIMKDPGAKTVLKFTDIVRKFNKIVHY